MTAETVLVTGGTGFVGGHCILQLLEKGYNVRTTIRSLDKVAGLKNSLELSGIPAKDLESKFSAFEADLTSDKGWKEALAGCDYVLHVASPMPLQKPKNENEVIVPAKEGTLRVIKQSEAAGVKKLVFTSSFAAIGYGHSASKRLTEEDWAIPELAPSAYVKSKGLAERAAWDYVKASKSNMKFTALNPTGIFGPKLPESPVPATSLIVSKILDGSSARGCPKFTFGIVDVRDVAKLHIEAMKMDSTDNQRYLLVAEENEYTMLQIANMLRTGLAAAKDPREKNLPTRELPTLLLRFIGLFSTEVSNFLPLLRESKIYSNKKAKETFKWTPITPETSVIDTYKSI